MICTGSVRGGFGEIWEKSVELSLAVRRRRGTFACSPRPCSGCHKWFGADGKDSIERWCLSPYVEKPFNSKVIKSFVPELRSRKCFVFRDSYVLWYVYMVWKFYVRFTYSCMAMLHSTLIQKLARKSEKKHKKIIKKFPGFNQTIYIYIYIFD